MRPPNQVTDEHLDRARRISAAITRVGLAALTQAHDVTGWAIYKWRNKGFVPNEQLEIFCRTTGERPHLVCDPSIAGLVKTRLPKAQTRILPKVGKAGHRTNGVSARE